MRFVLPFLVFPLLIACSQKAAERASANAASPAAKSVEAAIEEAAPVVQNEEVRQETSVEETAGEETDGTDEGEEDEFDDFESEFAQSPTEDVSDPLEGYNRFMTDVNDRLIVYVLDPVSRGYRHVAPEGFRRGINRFFHNLLYPVRLINNTLQAKFKRSGLETVRFAVNTTIGILGIFDPAKEWFGLEPHEEDFGQTLGFWGVAPGPHFVLPIFGPSNIRDSFGFYSDSRLDPITEVDPLEKEIGVRAYKAVNEYSLRIGEYESIKKDAVDLYIFMRDGYEQIRKKKIEE